MRHCRGHGTGARSVGDGVRIGVPPLPPPSAVRCTPVQHRSVQVAGTFNRLHSPASALSRLLIQGVVSEADPGDITLRQKRGRAPPRRFARHQITSSTICHPISDNKSELSAFRRRSECRTLPRKWAICRHFDAPGRIRTCDPRIRSPRSVYENAGSTAYLSQIQGNGPSNFSSEDSRRVFPHMDIGEALQD
jgi:hypothetical protein